ncbi:MAG: glycosyltransferase family 1 protein [Bacteroidota bacterium]
MPEKHLHIISFDIPWPANYGGVIDVYYKLVALRKAGIHLILHCFEYGREHAAELELLCDEVHYYPRQTGIGANLRSSPYIVESRKSDKLLNRLLQDNHPILFEGLHSCYYLDHPDLQHRKKVYRESNIEHHYYYHLFKAENNPARKAFFLIESLRLRVFQRKLKHADLMLVVSQSDTKYLQKHFPDREVIYLPSFHPSDDFSVIPGKGNYVLYHGKLSVTENLKAAEFLIEKVFAGLKHKLVIAGMDPPERLNTLAGPHPNVEIISNPDDEKMFSLIRNAQANILITFQATGLKLKLLNTLFKGRFCIVNAAMVQGTGLAELCETADGPRALRQKIDEVFQREFNINEVERRRKVLMQNYWNAGNAQRLIKLIWD